MTGEIAIKKLEEEQAKLKELSQKIWSEPEVGYLEQSASKWTAELLRDAGFTVELGAFGVPTAIRAAYGSGHPVIGLLGEYDALPGMSQKATTVKEAVREGAPGQGCGHNLLGVAHVGAAIGMKEEMEKRGLTGTVVYYGCPGEELLTGKTFMARNGAFADLDAAFAYHPGKINAANGGTMTGLNSAKFHFKGCTAHAGGDPHNGRSALDAVELMNVGANYLREHVTSDVRIHYTILDGGTAPNIVPDKACVWYYVRAMSRDVVESTYERLVKVAKGAAMMTETDVDIEFLGGCYNTMPNLVLSELLTGMMKKHPMKAWSEEEKAFAHALNVQSGPQWAAMCKACGVPEGTELFEGEPFMDNRDGYGSTDVGDVQHICPTATFNTVSSNMGAPGHSWHITSCSGMSIGEKGMLYAAEIMAAAGLRLMEDPSIAEKAKEEFDKRMAGKTYKCPMPADVPVPYSEQ
ncbi:MAG: amidohydrolase [Lachnospiraceae bacterium]|jgi:aminobenzoyl-glutamate utilization protein B|nr:amidohydrolase [Lachnospiraceae bacterium]